VILEHFSQALPLDLLDMTPLERLFAETESATAEEWVDSLVERAQPTQVAPEDRPDAIPVRTIFGAKGLEARTVFLINALQDCFTGRGSPADGVRRLYVAVTRARERLYISAPVHLGHTRLRHMIGRAQGGLANLIRSVAARLELPIENN
jgi:superfamily I DNA/RNA helicase